MLLSKITVDPARYQKRDALYSQATVEAILQEGIVLSKFDPLPLVQLVSNPYQFVVGGDGHSRYEAVIRLAERNRLPAAWRRDGDWDIPHKLISADEARELAWTGNLKGTSFSAVEEAKVFQEMLDAGIPMDKVATMTHRSETYIKKSLPLNGLCRDIRAMVGANPDAGGVDKHVAQVMAERFARYGIDPTVQSDLWHKVFKHADLTPTFVRSFIDTIGDEAAKRSSEGMLFELPTNVSHVMRSMKDRAQHLRQASRGLAWLMQCKDTGILDQLFPSLKALLDREGTERLELIKNQAETDGKIIGVACLAMEAAAA